MTDDLLIIYTIVAISAIVSAAAGWVTAYLNRRLVRANETYYDNRMALEHERSNNQKAASDSEIAQLKADSAKRDEYYEKRLKADKDYYEEKLKIDKDELQVDKDKLEQEKMKVDLERKKLELRNGKPQIPDKS